MTEPCPDKTLLLQAALDGELDAASAAALEAHVAGCPGCAETQMRLAALSREIRDGLRPYAAPDRLRRRFVATTLPARPARKLPAAAHFAIGALLAASLMLVLPIRGPAADDLVAGHIRALQPGHLTDVVSTDQHTVKPWFDGRIDFAPPVKDLAARDFPLVGGRLDYLRGRAVAALVYRRDKHVIDLFVWPGAAPADPASSHDGYNVVGWAEGGMAFHAVSDLNPAELAEFARDWRAQP